MAGRGEGDAQIGALEQVHAKRIAELEAELDFKARSEEARHKAYLDRMLELWKEALTPMSTVELLGLTPLQFVARYGSAKINNFVALYTGKGSGGRSAIAAGWGGSKERASSIASMLLGMPVVVAAIQERFRQGVQGHIASVEEIQARLSDEMRFAETSKDRRGAMELLLKSHGALVQKTESNTTLNFPGVVEELKAARERGKK